MSDVVTKQQVHEGTAKCEDLVCAMVNCKVCTLAIALYLLVVTSQRISINPIISPNPVYSHKHITNQCQKRDNCIGLRELEPNVGSHHGKSESQNEGLPRRIDGHNERLLRSDRAHSREYED